jgi:outer membrane protein assembly factor BamB
MLVLTPVLVRAADWPQWRGPNRDGVVEGFAAPARWPKTLKEHWRVTVGEGHASPVVADGKVYQFARQKDDEVLLCLEAATGKEVWRASYPAPYEMHAAALTHGKGPKSTPTVSGGKVYTLGIGGILSCFDARTGAVRWRKEFAQQYPRTSPLYGTAMSPLVEGGLCIAHVGGHDKGALTAFDAETGAVKWSYDGDGPGYASPIRATLAGERQVVTQTQNYVLGVTAATGQLLWRVPFKTDYDQNIITPVLYKDLLIYSGENQPITAVRLEKQGSALTPKEVWSNKAHALYMSSPVLKGNLLFGLSHRRSGQLFCLDADTGKTLWQTDGRLGENAALLQSGPVVFVLTNPGQLLVVKADAARYELLAQYQVTDSPTWAHPAPLGDRFLIKAQTTLACLACAD